jgi:hypothetical protein
VYDYITTLSYLDASASHGNGGVFEVISGFVWRDEESYKKAETA